MDWKKVWAGAIWQAEQSIRPNGAIFERVFRSPGSRLIFIRDGKVLLSRETRHELGGKTDFRLPGGKVFDTSEKYVAFLESSEDILGASRDSAVKEALEEVGLVVEPDALQYVGTDVLGATCSWDLIYWVCEVFTEHREGAQFHDSEADEIEGATWVSIPDACSMALNKNQFSESRSALALISYAKGKGYIKF